MVDPRGGSPDMGGMSDLHLTKIAYGCTSFDDLRARMAVRGARGEPILLQIRYKPKRADELVGGSLYWISQHRFGLRQPILGIEDNEGGGYLLRLAETLIEVEPRPRRAHQGWRYITAADVPADIPAGGGDGEGRIPPALQAELATLGLL